MKHYTVFFLGLFFVLHSLAQPFRYIESVFPETDTVKNVMFATAPWLNNHILLAGDIQLHAGENITEDRPLLMDIFLPKNDSVLKRPAILFAHAGGFLLGSRKNDDMIALCDSFARRGFVTATFDYRIGMGSTVTTFLGIILHVSVNPKNAKRSVYRAIQDSRAAIRFLKQNAGLYGIDTTKIYMAGSSAGGFVALHNIYMNTEKEISPEIFDSPELGGLDSIGIKGFNANPNAAISMWGALQNTDLIEDNQTPVFLIHGESDEIVPFKTGIPLESLVPDIAALEYNMIETYGSFCIDTALSNRGIAHETYFVPDKNHEFYGVNTGMFPETGPNQYWDTIQNKIAVFLFNQFKPTAKYEFTTQNLTANFLNTSASSFYTEWDFGDGNSKTGVSVMHTFLQKGEYKALLKTCNDNLACDTISKWVKVGIDNPDDSTNVTTEIFKNSQFRVFPNPAREKIYISGTPQNYSAAIYNSFGIEIKKIKNSTNTSIDISQFKNGIYIIRFESNEYRIVRKFLKSD